jgi:hypothetical protein
MENDETIGQESPGSSFIVFQTPMERIREAIAANLGDDGLSATDFERIKIPAGGGLAFTIQTLNGEESVKELTGIIVDWRDRRAYWKLTMEQSDGNTAPDCYSPDARVGIGTPGGECSKCEFAQFGSDSNGGQACKLSRELWILRENKILPEIVSLPPTSIKQVRQYLARLAAEVIPFYGAITKTSLEKTKNTQSIVFSRATFALAGRLTPEQTAHIKKYAAMLRPSPESAPPALQAADLQQGLQAADDLQQGAGEVI